MAKDNNQESSEQNKQPVTTPQAAVPSNSNIVFIGFFGIICLIVVYYIYNAFKGEDNIETKIPVPKNIAKPPVSQDNSGINIPQLPQIPKLLAPVEGISDVKILPPLPPSPPIAPQASVIDLPKPIEQKSSDSGLKEQTVVAKEQKIKEDNKRKASIMAYGGGGGAKQDEKAISKAQLDDFTDISRNSVSFKGAPEYLLAKGKIIDSIIEVPINSGIGGEIRAIISRDVYSQSGKIILIPKGSRAIGNYSTGVGKPVGVINVNWERIDLVNGYVVKLTKTSGVNNLGMVGTNGDVDYKIAEQITKTLMSSVISIASAVGLDSIAPVSPITTTTNNNSLNATSFTTLYQAIMLSVAIPNQTIQEKAQKLCNDGLNALKSIMLANSTNPIIALITNLNLENLCNDVNRNYQQIITDFATANSFLTNNGTFSSTDNSATSKAAAQAYTDLNNTLKSIAGTQDITTVVTIPQGSVIKMYIGQDIEFPKEAIDRSR